MEEVMPSPAKSNTQGEISFKNKSFTEKTNGTKLFESKADRNRISRESSIKSINSSVQDEEANGDWSHRPRKWFSFTNLLNRHHQFSGSSFFRKSRLTVSSTLSSVFNSSNSSPSEDEKSFPKFPDFSDFSFRGTPNVSGHGECRSAVLGRKNPPNRNGNGFENSEIYNSNNGLDSTSGDFFSQLPSLESQSSLPTYFNKRRSEPVNSQCRKNLVRSLPTLLESMDAPNENDGLEKAKSVTVESVIDLLYQEFAILTGAKSISDHYILIFPDRGNFHMLSDDDYRKLILYLTSLPPLQDADNGFILIIDRRNDKWNSVKSALLRISNFFPGLIYKVYVLRPVSFLHKALSEVSSKLFRNESLKFCLNICANVSDLTSIIRPENLIVDLGGTLVYDKGKFVQQRLEVEAFCSALHGLSKELKLFTHSFQDFEYPNDVHSTQNLIHEKINDYERLNGDLVQAATHGECLLIRMKSLKENESYKNNSIQMVNVVSVERFILQIEETTKLFQKFWAKEKVSLEQCLLLRKFEQDFRELQATFDLNVKSLNFISDYGSTLLENESLLGEAFNFQRNSVEDIKKAKNLEKIGREIVENNPDAVDSVEPKCVELCRMSSHLKFIIEEKTNNLQQARKCLLIIEKANQLCSESSSFLNPLESHEIINENDLHNLDLYIAKIEEEINEINSFTVSPNSTFSWRLHSNEVIKKLEGILRCCEERRGEIEKLLKVPSKKFTLKALENQLRSNSKKRNSTEILSQIISPDSVDLFIGSSSSSSISNDKDSAFDFDGEIVEKRRHVLNELIQTEKTYVKEIGEVITGYRDQTNNPNFKALLPKQLQIGGEQEKNSDNLFCNLDEIYKFHSKIFLPDLENCIDSIELVGLCFVQRYFDFLTMYSQYCQLLPASEMMRKEIGENHPWFLECRKLLGHKLPLGAYLLKPVQRITKYHLLLKDLLKYSQHRGGRKELNEALELMLVVLRRVNDGMHQLSINGYPGCLTDEGPLLLQGAFLLWTETKKDRLRLKGHQRHLFLYMKSVLICKKSGKSTFYDFKSKLDLSEVGLTETLKGSGSSKKFEIWIQGRQKVFVLQAENQEMKDIWVCQIKKLLLEQLESLKVTKGSFIHHNSSGLKYKRSKMLTTKGVSINGWPQQFPHHRSLRQVSSCEMAPIPLGRPKSQCESYEEEWSTDVSNSDDEDKPNSLYGIGEEVNNGPKYLALADYNPVGSAEIVLKEGDVVTVVKIGCAGWWFVSNSSVPGVEGWAPSAYLEKVDKSSRGSVSSSCVSGEGGSENQSSDDLWKPISK